MKDRTEYMRAYYCAHRSRLVATKRERRKDGRENAAQRRRRALDREAAKAEFAALRASL